MTPKQKQLKADLSTCVTLQDVFSVCAKHYDLKSAKLGIGTRAVVTAGIINAIDMLKPKENV